MGLSALVCVTTGEPAVVALDRPGTYPWIPALRYPALEVGRDQPWSTEEMVVLGEVQSRARLRFGCIADPVTVVSDEAPCGWNLTVSRLGRLLALIHSRTYPWGFHGEAMAAL